MDKTYTDKDARTEQANEEEVAVTPEFVTISHRVPTRTYYEQEIASQTERELIASLNEELAQFLGLISYCVEHSHWNPDGTSYERAFDLKPVLGATEPFPKDLPSEVRPSDADIRQGRPLFSSLCDAWIGMEPAMRDAYDAIAEVESAYHDLDKQAWNIVLDGNAPDLDSYSRAMEERDKAARALADAKARYMGIVRDALASVSAIATEHLDEAHRYAWGDLGFDEWLRESTDTPIA